MTGRHTSSVRYQPCRHACSAGHRSFKGHRGAGLRRSRAREARRRPHAVARERGWASTRSPRRRAASTTPATSITPRNTRTEAAARSGLVLAAAGPGAQTGLRVGALHQRFGLVPPPLTGPSSPERAMPRPGRHPFSCRCKPRGHCRDHARVPGRWSSAQRCRFAASPPSAFAAAGRPRPAPSSPSGPRTSRIAHTRGAYSEFGIIGTIAGRRTIPASRREAGGSRAFRSIVSVIVRDCSGRPTGRHRAGSVPAGCRKARSSPLPAP